VPYDRLANIEGWSLWLGHPPVPDALDVLPAPEPLIWDEPATAVATALLVAADYAIRRGATTAAEARTLLQRESPVAIVVPDTVHANLRLLLEDASDSGVPAIYRRVETPEELAENASSFAVRRRAHEVDLGRRHDPALSFQTRVPAVTIGGTARSSFVVHNEPKRDGITISGELSERVGIELGVSGNGITAESTAEIELFASHVPAFLDGISSVLSEHSLTIGWREGDSPDPFDIAEAFRTWLKALLGASIVDVRIAFAPNTGRSALLSEMRARATAFREKRDSILAGSPDPLVMVPTDIRMGDD
jgi:hypothetical protein